MSDDLLRIDEFASNPTPRVPICLCLDTSGSMLTGDGYGGRSRISELQAGIEQFFAEIRADEMTRYSAEICIVTFGGDAQCLLDFAGIERQRVPQLAANGGTQMGAGVNLALDLLEARKQAYRDNGVDYYQPWLVLMSDGAPGDPIELATQRVSNLVVSKKLTAISIGIGDECNMDVMSQFGGQAVRLQVLKFREFFAWLSRSISRVSHSTPSDDPNLDPLGTQPRTDD